MKIRCFQFLLAIAVVLLIFSCDETAKESEKKMSIEQSSFGKTEDGKSVNLYTLTNANGLKARITNYGAIVTSLLVPDRNGNFADIVLGYDTLDEYIKDSAHFGGIIGRCTNRIGKAKFTLQGVEYKLTKNEGENHLHGGIKGFDKVVWNAEPMQTDQGPALKLTYFSKDGEEGYPGNLSTTVIYLLTDNNELKISYQAETDKPTPVNLTNHSYFNLAGHNAGSILSHELTINADSFTAVDDNLIPTGQIKPVKGTSLDFTKPMVIGARIAQVESGYDQNYVLNNPDGSLSHAATVYEPKTARTMQLYTTEPGMQLYTGNFLDGIKGKGGALYNKHDAFCLETQHFPDSPNKPQFPSVILEPGKKYNQLTVYKFSVR